PNSIAAIEPTAAPPRNTVLRGRACRRNRRRWNRRRCGSSSLRECRLCRRSPTQDRRWTRDGTSSSSARKSRISSRGQTGPAAAWRVIRSRNFGPYFFGNAASASGTWFQNLAASILVYQLTHSPFLLGVLNFCQFVPSLVLAPWAGTLADRFDRRRLVLASQLISSVLSGALAALAFAGEATEWVVIGFAGALGLALAVSQPAQMALVPSLVRREQVPRA